MENSSKEEYEKFLDFCSVSLKGENPKFLDLIKTRYAACDDVFRCSGEMVKLLEKTQRNMANEESRKFVHLKDFLTKLKIHTAAKWKKKKKRRHSSDSESDSTHSAKVPKLKDCAVMVTKFPNEDAALCLKDEVGNTIDTGNNIEFNLKKTCSIADGDVNNAFSIIIADDEQVNMLREELGSVTDSESPISLSQFLEPSFARRIDRFGREENSTSGSCSSSPHIPFSTKGRSSRKHVVYAYDDDDDDDFEDDHIGTESTDFNDNDNYVASASLVAQEPEKWQVENDKNTDIQTSPTESIMNSPTKEPSKKKSIAIIDVNFSNSPDVLAILPSSSYQTKEFSDTKNIKNKTAQKDDTHCALTKCSEMDNFQNVDIISNDTISPTSIPENKENSSNTSNTSIEVPAKAPFHDCVEQASPPLITTIDSTKTASVQNEVTIDPQDCCSGVVKDSLSCKQTIHEDEAVQNQDTLVSEDKPSVDTSVKRVPLTNVTKDVTSSSGSYCIKPFSSSFGKQDKTAQKPSSSAETKVVPPLVEERLPEAGDSADEFQKVDNILDKSKLKQKRRVAKLEHLLQSLRDEIEKCQDAEMTLEDLDDDNAAYIFEDKLKRKFVAVWNKLCEVTERTVTTGRPTEKRVRFSGTRYQEINRRIEKFLNKKKEFPDFHDIKSIVKLTNKKCNLNLSAMLLNDISREAFVDIGEMLQTRRHQDFIATFGTRQTDVLRGSEDPYLTDPEFRRKVDTNRQVAKSNLDNVIAKYTKLQQERFYGEDREETEEESDEEDDEISRKTEKNNPEEHDKHTSEESREVVEDIVTTESIEVDIAEEDDDDDDLNRSSSGTYNTAEQPVNKYNPSVLSLGRSAYLLSPDKGKPIGSRSSGADAAKSGDFGEMLNTNSNADRGSELAALEGKDDGLNSNTDSIIVIDESPAKSQQEAWKANPFKARVNPYSLNVQSNIQAAESDFENGKPNSAKEFTAAARGPNIKYTARKPLHVEGAAGLNTLGGGSGDLGEPKISPNCEMFDDDDEDEDQSSDSTSEQDADDKFVDDDVDEIVMIINRSESECDTVSSRDPSPISVVSLSSESLDDISSNWEKDGSPAVESPASLPTCADDELIPSPKVSNTFSHMQKGANLEKCQFMEAMGIRKSQNDASAASDLTDRMLHEKNKDIPLFQTIESVEITKASQNHTMPMTNVEVKSTGWQQKQPIVESVLVINRRTSPVNRFSQDSDDCIILPDTPTEVLDAKVVDQVTIAGEGPDSVKKTLDFQVLIEESCEAENAEVMLADLPTNKTPSGSCTEVHRELNVHGKDVSDMGKKTDSEETLFNTEMFDPEAMETTFPQATAEQNGSGKAEKLRSLFSLLQKISGSATDSFMLQDNSTESTSESTSNSNILEESQDVQMETTEMSVSESICGHGKGTSKSRGKENINVLEVDGDMTTDPSQTDIRISEVCSIVPESCHISSLGNSDAPLGPNTCEYLNKTTSDSNAVQNQSAARNRGAVISVESEASDSCGQDLSTHSQSLSSVSQPDLPLCVDVKSTDDKYSSTNTTVITRKSSSLFQTSESNSVTVEDSQDSCIEIIEATPEDAQEASGSNFRLSPEPCLTLKPPNNSSPKDKEAKRTAANHNAMESTKVWQIDSDEKKLVCPPSTDNCFRSTSSVNITSSNIEENLITKVPDDTIVIDLCESNGISVICSEHTGTEETASISKHKVNATVDNMQEKLAVEDKAGVSNLQTEIAIIETPEQIECGNTKVKTPEQTERGNTKVKTPEQTERGNTKVKTPGQAVCGNTKVKTPGQAECGNTKVKTPEQTERGNTKVKTPEQTERGKTKVKTPGQAEYGNTKKTPEQTERGNTKVKTPEQTERGNTKVKKPEQTERGNTKVKTPEQTERGNTKVKTPGQAEYGNTNMKTPEQTERGNTNMKTPEQTERGNTKVKKPEQAECGNTKVKTPGQAECGNTKVETSEQTEHGNTKVETPEQTECVNTKVKTSVQTECGNTKVETSKQTERGNTKVETREQAEYGNTKVESPKNENCENMNIETFNKFEHDNTTKHSSKSISQDSLNLQERTVLDDEAVSAIDSSLHIDHFVHQTPLHSSDDSKCVNCDLACECLHHGRSSESGNSFVGQQKQGDTFSESAGSREENVPDQVVNTQGNSHTDIVVNDVDDAHNPGSSGVNVGINSDGNNAGNVHNNGNDWENVNTDIIGNIADNVHTDVAGNGGNSIHSDDSSEEHFHSNNEKNDYSNGNDKKIAHTDILFENNEENVHRIGNEEENVDKDGDNVCTESVGNNESNADSSSIECDEKNVHSNSNDGENVHSNSNDGENVHSNSNDGENVHSNSNDGENVHSNSNAGENVHSNSYDSENVHGVRNEGIVSAGSAGNREDSAYTDTIGNNEESVNINNTQNNDGDGHTGRVGNKDNFQAECLGKNEEDVLVDSAGVNEGNVEGDGIEHVGENVQADNIGNVETHFLASSVGNCENIEADVENNGDNVKADYVENNDENVQADDVGDSGENVHTDGVGDIVKNVQADDVGNIEENVQADDVGDIGENVQADVDGDIGENVQADDVGDSMENVQADGVGSYEENILVNSVRNKGDSTDKIGDCNRVMDGSDEDKSNKPCDNVIEDENSLFCDSFNNDNIGASYNLNVQMVHAEEKCMDNKIVQIVENEQNRMDQKDITQRSDNDSKNKTCHNLKAEDENDDGDSVDLLNTGPTDSDTDGGEKYVSKQKDLDENSWSGHIVGQKDLDASSGEGHTGQKDLDAYSRDIQTEGQEALESNHGDEHVSELKDLEGNSRDGNRKDTDLIANIEYGHALGQEDLNADSGNEHTLGPTDLKADSGDERTSKQSDLDADSKDGHTLGLTDLKADSGDERTSKQSDLKADSGDEHASKQSDLDANSRGENTSKQSDLNANSQDGHTSKRSDLDADSADKQSSKQSDLDADSEDRQSSKQSDLNANSRDGHTSKSDLDTSSGDGRTGQKDLMLDNRDEHASKQNLCSGVADNTSDDVQSSLIVLDYQSVRSLDTEVEQCSRDSSENDTVIDSTAKVTEKLSESILSNKMNDSGNLRTHDESLERTDVGCDEEEATVADTDDVNSSELVSLGECKDKEDDTKNEEKSVPATRDIAKDDSSKDAEPSSSDDDSKHVKPSSLDDEDEVKIIEELSSAQGVRHSDNSKEDDRRLVDQLLSGIGFGKTKEDKLSPEASADKPLANEPGKCSDESVKVETENSSHKPGDSSEKPLPEKVSVSLITNSLCHSSVLSVECEEVDDGELSPSSVCSQEPDAIEIQPTVKSRKRPCNVDDSELSPSSICSQEPDAIAIQPTVKSRKRTCSDTRLGLQSEKKGEQSSEEINAVSSNAASSSVIDVETLPKFKKPKGVDHDLINEIISSVLAEFPPSGSASKFPPYKAKHSQPKASKTTDIPEVVIGIDDDDDDVVIMEESSPGTVQRSVFPVALHQSRRHGLAAFKQQSSVTAPFGRGTTSSASQPPLRKPGMQTYGNPNHGAQNVPSTSFQYQPQNPPSNGRRFSFATKNRSPAFMRSKNSLPPTMISSQNRASQSLPRLSPRVPIPSIQSDRASELARTSPKPFPGTSATFVNRRFQSSGHIRSPALGHIRSPALGQMRSPTLGQMRSPTVGQVRSPAPGHSGLTFRPYLPNTSVNRKRNFNMSSMVQSPSNTLALGVAQRGSGRPTSHPRQPPFGVLHNTERQSPQNPALRQRFQTHQFQQGPNTASRRPKQQGVTNRVEIILGDSDDEGEFNNAQSAGPRIVSVSSLSASAVSDTSSGAPVPSGRPGAQSHRRNRDVIVIPD